MLRKFWQVCCNCNLPVHTIFPTEKNFVWKFHIFIISDNDRKKIELRQAFFGGIVKTEIYVCIRTFWQKLLSFWERCKPSSLSDLQRIFFWILSKIIGEVFQNRSLRVRLKTLSKKGFVETPQLFLSFSDLEQKIFVHLSGIFWRGC